MEIFSPDNEEKLIFIEKDLRPKPLLSFDIKILDLSDDRIAAMFPNLETLRLKKFMDRMPMSLEE